MPKNKLRVIAVIPARGGSKGIIGKNLKTINGIPLVARAIITAQNCRNIDEVYVSSDSVEILNVAKMYGAKVHHRSDFASNDDASTEDALNDFLEYLGNQNIPEFLTYLQCTSPFIDSDEIVSGIDLIQKEEKIDTVFSAKKFHGFIWQNNTRDYSSSGLNHNHLEQRKRRQDLDYEHLVEDGSFYILRTDKYLKTLNRFGKNPYAFKSKVRPYSEIDDPEDLEISSLLAPFFDGPSNNRIKDVKLIVSDFDGVMTDDSVQIDMHGNETVQVSRADGMAINIFRNQGINTIVISTEVNPVVKMRCKKLNIEYFQGIEDKLSTLKKYCDTKNIALKDVAYVGNDINDLDCLMAVGTPIIVNDAAHQLKKFGFIQIAANGGNKALRKLAEIILKT